MNTTIALTVARSLEDVDADLIYTFQQGMKRLAGLIPEPPPFRFVMLLQGAGEGCLYRYLTGQYDPKINREVRVHDRDVVSTYHRLQKMIDGADAVLAIDDSRDPGDPQQPAPQTDSYEAGVDGGIVTRGSTSGKMTLPGASRWVLSSTQIASCWNIPCAYVRLGTNGERITDWHSRPRLFGPAKSGAFFNRKDVEPTDFVPTPTSGWPEAVVA